MSKIEQSPILITGCARSGTSMVAGAIHRCGAFGGVLTGATKYNQKGQHENAYIRDNVEKKYLNVLGLDPLGQTPLLDHTSTIYIPNKWREWIEDTMIREGYKSGPWYYKGAKACQIWPVWNNAFPNAKWVIVRRRSVDIVDSCLETSFMYKRQTEEEWMDWIHYHEQRFVEMIQAGLNVKQIWPERMVHGNYEQLYEVIEWLGLSWKSQEVMNWIEPKLWKARKKAGIKL